MNKTNDTGRTTQTNSKIVHWAATHVGQRDRNEDNHWPKANEQHDLKTVRNKGFLYIVADGMGGYAAGDVASNLAVQACSNTYYSDPNPDIAASLRGAILAADKSIREVQASSSEKANMGCTLVAAVVQGGKLWVAHVGDSRCYRLRKEGNGSPRFKQLTTDHSWVAEQVKHKILTPEEARNHPYRSTLTHALGQPNMSPEPDIHEVEDGWQIGDRLLMCSDGLWEMVDDPNLANLLNKYGKLPEAAEVMVQMAVRSGGEDNITAMLVEDARSQMVSKRPLFNRLPRIVWIGLIVAGLIFACFGLWTTVFGQLRFGSGQTATRPVELPPPATSLILPTLTPPPTPMHTQPSASPSPAPVPATTIPLLPTATSTIAPRPTSTLPACQAIEVSQEYWAVVKAINNNQIAITQNSDPKMVLNNGMGLITKSNLNTLLTEKGFGENSVITVKFANLSNPNGIIPVYGICYVNNHNEFWNCQSNSLPKTSQNDGFQASFDFKANEAQQKQLLIKIFSQFNRRGQLIQNQPSLKVTSVEVCRR